MYIPLILVASHQILSRRHVFYVNLPSLLQQDFHLNNQLFKLNSHLFYSQGSTTKESKLNAKIVEERNHLLEQIHNFHHLGRSCKKKNLVQCGPYIILSLPLLINTIKSTCIHYGQQEGSIFVLVFTIVRQSRIRHAHSSLLVRFGSNDNIHTCFDLE